MGVDTGLLDGLENKVLDLARSRPDSAPAWEELRQELEASGLSPEPPVADPDEARRSAAELRHLVNVFSGVRAAGELPVGDRLTRAGYEIEGRQGTTDAHVRPAFAEALEARASPEQLQRLFPDLWAVDHALWQMLSQKTTTAAVAERWLASPGRRAVQELAVLHGLASADDSAHQCPSPKDLPSTVGPLPADAGDMADAAPEWRELHFAVPGAAFQQWEPARKDDVTAAIAVLVGRRGDPVFLRGAALAWLLRRAATNPIFTIDGAERDLREDLIPALTLAFPAKGDPGWAELRAAAKLETASLNLAAYLVHEQDPAVALPRMWSCARWIQSSTFRSPFFGGDEETLAERLKATLPTEEPDFSARADIFAPGRFRDDGTGYDISEMSFLYGLWSHYFTEADVPQLTPTPMPIVNALRRLASRTLNAFEAKLETDFLNLSLEHDTKQTSAAAPSLTSNLFAFDSPSIAPPVLARTLLTINAISWFTDLPRPAQDETLTLLKSNPTRYNWFSFALYREVGDLSSTLREKCVDAWKAVADAIDEKFTVEQEYGIILLGTALIPEFDVVDRERLLAIVSRAPVDNMSRAYEKIASGADKVGNRDLWKRAMDSLMKMVEETGDVDPKDRLRAALLALRRLSATTTMERDAYLNRLAGLSGSSPFKDNIQLRRELRRLGVKLPDSKERP
jgi:hypothetical protein